MKAVIDSSELLPSNLLDAMIADYFDNPLLEDIWLTKNYEGIPIAVA
ncbi:MAG: hypothetical protein WBA23_24285 [Tunicatimonas sp.]